MSYTDLVVSDEPRLDAAKFSGPSDLATELNHRAGNGPLPVWVVFRRSSIRVTPQNVAGVVRGLRVAAEMLSDREET